MVAVEVVTGKWVRNDFQFDVEMSKTRVGIRTLQVQKWQTGDIPCSAQQRGLTGLSPKDAPHSNMNLRRSSPGFTRSIVKEESESTMARKKLKLVSSTASFEVTSERHELANISSLRARC